MLGSLRPPEATKFDLPIECSEKIFRGGLSVQGGSKQKDSLKSPVIARECNVLELVDELDNRWTNDWTAPPNPLRELSYGDHGHSPKSVVARDLAVGQELDTIAKVGAH